MQTKNDQIFSVSCPWDSPCQGKDLRILFVCSAGILRSATASRMYAKRYNTRAAGSHRYALVPVSVNLLAWAQRIVFMNPENHSDVCRYFDLNEYFNPSEITVLRVPDIYNHMDPILVSIIEEQFERISDA